MSDPDFTKIDPLTREYILELREAAKKAKGDLKAVELERDALRQRLEEVLAEKLPERETQAVDVRTLSPKDYEKALRDMRHKAVLAGYDERQANRIPAETKDAKTMTPDEYKDWKLKVTGRKAWRETINATVS